MDIVLRAAIAYVFIIFLMRVIGRRELSSLAPTDIVLLVVLWRLHYKLSLRDLAEMFLTRGFIFTYEAVREWEAKLAPALAENLRRKRTGRVGRSWYVVEVLT